MAESIPDKDLAATVFGQFTSVKIAELTGRDERTIQRWRAGNLSKEGRTILSGLANSYGLLDHEVTNIAKLFHALSPARQAVVRELFTKIRIEREQEYSTRVVDGAPTDDHPLFGLLLRYHRDKHFERTLDLMDAWSRCDDFDELPENAKARAFGFWGVAANRRMNHGKAERLLRSGLDIATDAGLRENLKLELAIALDRQGRLEDAQKSLEECAEEPQDEPNVLYNLMCFFGRNNELKKADNVAEKVLRVSPTIEDSDDYLGRLILSDPDLGSYRRSELFGQRFRVLGGLAGALALALIVMGASFEPSDSRPVDMAYGSSMGTELAYGSSMGTELAYGSSMGTELEYNSSMGGEFA